jgi:hypothetical protein
MRAIANAQINTLICKPATHTLAPRIKIICTNLLRQGFHKEPELLSHACARHPEDLAHHGSPHMLQDPEDAH